MDFDDMTNLLNLANGRKLELTGELDSIHAINEVISLATEGDPDPIKASKATLKLEAKAPKTGRDDWCDLGGTLTINISEMDEEDRCLIAKFLRKRSQAITSELEALRTSWYEVSTAMDKLAKKV